MGGVTRRTWPSLRARTAFWRFVQKRQQAWAAKNGLTQPPRDPVLARAKFTNIWRALDRGTLFAIQMQRALAGREAAWGIPIYRAMNRIDAFCGLFYHGRMDPLAFNPVTFMKTAAAWRASGDKVFTGVYQSTRTFIGEAWPGDGAPMDRRLAAYAWELAGRAQALSDGLEQISGRRAAFQLIRGATIKTVLGPFAAHQAMLDLDYWHTWDDDWVHVGPGARKAIGMMFGDGARKNALDHIIALKETQPRVAFAPRHPNGGPVPLRLPDIEHALCEWQKYERIKAGGHAKGVYVPAGAGQWKPESPVPPWMTLPEAT